MTIHAIGIKNKDLDPSSFLPHDVLLSDQLTSFENKGPHFKLRLVAQSSNSHLAKVFGIFLSHKSNAKIYMPQFLFIIPA
jgi:hypothetical protein